MGVLRTIFALAVVFSHAMPDRPVFVGARNAVQLFYMISGFLMSFILGDGQRYRSTLQFYISRYLRLYPLYFTVLLATLIWLYASSDIIWWDAFKSFPRLLQIQLVASNALLLGQDLSLFEAVNNHSVSFTTNFLNSAPPVYEGLVIPQSWTLGLELLFYGVAPFILRQRKRLVLVLLVSLCLRLVIIQLGFGTKDPWTYRFFPTELATFLLGALSHQILFHKVSRLEPALLSQLALAATALMVALSVFYQLIPGRELVRIPLYFGLFWLCLPFCFFQSLNRRIDRVIGDLSYPIYIAHMLVLAVVVKFGIPNQIPKYYFGAFVAAAAIAFAYLLNAVIGHPAERYRNRLIRRFTPAVVKTALPVIPQTHLN